MNPYKRNLLIIVSVISTALVVAFNGCGGGMSTGSGSNGSSGTGGTGIGAFQSGFYAFAQTQGCAQCHGTVQNPLFASPDINTAYTAASGLVDFNKPNQSVLISYVGNSHCVAAGGTAAICGVISNESIVQADLVAWAIAEGGAASTLPNYITPTMPIPTPVPLITAKTPGVIRFQLSGLKPAVPSLAKAVLELTVQLANPTEYHLSNPRIAGITEAVTIQGLHIFINTSTGTGMGNEQVSQGAVWDTLTATAAIFALPSPLPAGPLAATPLSTMDDDLLQLSPSDVLTIGIDQITPTN